MIITENCFTDNDDYVLMLSHYYPGFITGNGKSLHLRFKCRLQLQAVCKDRLFPKVDFFARGYGKDEEPRRAYALAFVIAVVIVLIGNYLNLYHFLLQIHFINQIN